MIVLSFNILSTVYSAPCRGSSVGTVAVVLVPLLLLSLLLIVGSYHDQDDVC